MFVPAFAVKPVITVIFIVSVLVQPFAPVTVTVYVVVKVGVTVVEAVPAPLLHAYVVPPVALSVVD